MEQPLLGGKKKKKSKDDLSATKLPLILRFPRHFNVFCIILYFAIGFTVLNMQEDWEPSTVLYVVVQIITTIGYGDVTIHNGGKIFMTLYVLLGVLLIADFVNNAFDNVLNKAESQLTGLLRNVESTVDGKAKEFHPSRRNLRLDLLAAIVLYAAFVGGWVAFFTTYEGCTCVVGGERLPGCKDDDCAETGGKQLTAADAAYMAVITFSTVGFGDYTPQTQIGRMVGSVWMILGTLSFANLVGAVSKLLRGKREEYHKKTRVTKEAFRIIDEDGTGFIDRLEFMRYVLVREGKVARETLEQIDKTFDHLDRNGNGKLSFAEINSNFQKADEE